MSELVLELPVSLPGTTALFAVERRPPSPDVFAFLPECLCGRPSLYITASTANSSQDRLSWPLRPTNLYASSVRVILILLLELTTSQIEYRTDVFIWYLRQEAQYTNIKNMQTFISFFFELVINRYKNNKDSRMS